VKLNPRLAVQFQVFAAQVGDFLNSGAGTLLRWYRSGINPQQRLWDLSTFMGHVHPASTAVYLTITAELLDQANQRFNRFAAPLLTGVAR
jgi:hypothetical protein